MGAARITRLMSSSVGMMAIIVLSFQAEEVDSFSMPSSIINLPHTHASSNHDHSTFYSSKNMSPSSLFAILNIDEDNNNNIEYGYSQSPHVQNHYYEEDLLSSEANDQYYQQQQQQYDAVKNSSSQQQQQQHRDHRTTAAGVATVLAAGTVFALGNSHGESGMAAQAMSPVKTSNNVVTSASTASSDILKSINNNNRAEPAVTLPYLEEQIRAAELKLQQQRLQLLQLSEASNVFVADATAATAPAPPKPAATAPATASAHSAATATTTRAPETPKPAAATTSASTSSATQPKPATEAPKPATTNTAASTAAPAKPATTTTSNSGSGITATPTSKPAPNIKADMKKNPSLYRYTKEHIPIWYKAGKKFYVNTEPKVIKAVQVLSREIDTRITPKVIKWEHEILGDANSEKVDKVVSYITSVGKFALKVVGKTIPILVDGTKYVIKVTPQIIDTGKKVYMTVDKQIIPEIKKDVKIVKQTIGKRTPQIIDASKQVYETGKQLSLAIEEDVIPKVCAAEKKIEPKLQQFEHLIVGDTVGDAIDQTLVKSIDTGKRFVVAVDKNAPKVVAATKKTANGIYKTGTTVFDTGKQVYHVLDENVPKVIKTTKTVVTQLDRTGGQIAYAIDEKVPVVVAAIDKGIPKVVATGKQIKTALDPAMTQVVESGKAITADVVNLVENPSRFGIELTPDERDKAAKIVGAGIATGAIATAINSATSDSYLVDTYGRYDDGFSESQGFPALFSRGSNPPSRSRFRRIR